MAEFTDLEREVNMELAKRGMAPTIIGLAERIELGRSVDLSDLMDVGVGEPQLGDAEEQATEVYANAGADAGDYGNLAPLPFREGRDPYEATLLDDPSRSI